MTTIDPEPSEPAPTLPYAARLPADVRTSRLAIASLIVSVLGSPCLLGAFSNWINWYVPMEFNQVGRYGFVHFWFIRSGLIIATVLPIIAIIRIALSRRRRIGMRIAIGALLLALLWWGFEYLAYLMWRDFKRD